MPGTGSSTERGFALRKKQLAWRAAAVTALSLGAAWSLLSERGRRGEGPEPTSRAAEEAPSPSTPEAPERPYRRAGRQSAIRPVLDSGAPSQPPTRKGAGGEAPPARGSLWLSASELHNRPRTVGLRGT